jgi:PfaD family protein
MNGHSPIGTWQKGPWVPAFTATDLSGAIPFVREPVHIVSEPNSGRVGVARGGAVVGVDQANGVPTFPLLASLPPLYPEWLGDRSFTEVHNLRFPYVAGAMANGIATTDIVIEMAQAGMLGFFGAAGLHPDRISKELDTLEGALGTSMSWGSNLIHAPNEPTIEMATVELYLKRGVRRVSASAYMGLNAMIVRYAYTGISKGADGRILRKNFVFAKISRPEVAGRFLNPAPTEMLNKLVADGHLTPAEAALGAQLPVAEDIIVEADSGGHTDNQTLTALFPTILGLRDAIATERNYQRPIRIGAAGGLGTPSAVAAAFGLGAAFVLTGSVNQGCIESGLDTFGKTLLANCDLADVTMAPAADMFELGVEVQVLKRGTMFGVRAKRLYEAYSSYASMDAIPADKKKRLEKEVFQMSLEDVWETTESFWAERDPKEVDKANRDPKHKMALCFRWYLGLSSKWAIWGTEGRGMDYQIWCGPAMGAFNAWAKGSFLEKPENRTVVQVARNLLEGAAVITRAQQLRTYGIAVPSGSFAYTPRPLA